MDLGLKGSVVMVAAGSKGIGRAAVELFRAEGAQVSFCARGHESVKAVAEATGATGYVADVTSADSLAEWHAATVRDLGAPSVVVTNTGGPPAGRLADMTEDQWRAGIDSTVFNVLRLAALTVPAMREAKFGRLIHVTSLVAREPSSMLPISSTLRAGLIALTKLQADEFAADGVTVNSVLPGHTLTDRQVHLAEMVSAQRQISVEDALKLQADHSPMGRLAQPHEIAAAIVFLASRSAGFITGQSLVVDGGANRGL
jgi:3-oxoacyl-[acyl-carrier protein] reductase